LGRGIVKWYRCKPPQAKNIDLNLRVLYRLRFLSEQHPLDITSFQYCLALGLEILDVAKRSEKERSETEEQITLVLEFISFQATLCNLWLQHCLYEGDNRDLPRQRLLERLLDVMLFVPAVSKLARDSFLQVTHAMSRNNTPDELDVLVGGLLSPSANVRNAVLQSLQPYDLEEIKSTEAMFLAMHDSDERNSELAVSLYEENAIELDSSGVWRLFCLLGLLVHISY
jgi:hypothetical protein